ncbi:MAG: SMI1/KNR4 family protein [Myxococcales bacterium]|nr:SMI1/KNR4 family protein [Myxococcales bacterium]
MTASDRVQNALARIEAWAAAHGATLGLLPGATEETVASLEAELGRPLPADYRAFLRLHDGQDPDAPMPWLPHRDRLQPIATCLDQWRFERDASEDDGVEELSEDDVFHLTVSSPLRYPIAGSRWLDQDNTYLDFHPGPAGVDGQLLGLVSECDWEVFGASFAEALEEHARRLEAGELVWSDEEGPVPA